MSDLDTKSIDKGSSGDVVLGTGDAEEKGIAVMHTSFDAKAEARLRRKIDVHIIPIVAVMYLFCFIDRANIGNARLAKLKKDLGMTGYDYNTLLSAFYVAYILFELPSNLMCKRVGPGKWLPFLTFCFGILSLCMAFVHSFGAAIALRFLLGVAEAGHLPGIAYYLVSSSSSSLHPPIWRRQLRRTHSRAGTAARSSRFGWPCTSSAHPSRAPWEACWPAAS